MIEEEVLLECIVLKKIDESMEGSLVGKKYLGISKLINKRIESPGSA